jgi:hypothetical protein
MQDCFNVVSARTILDQNVSPVARCPHRSTTDSLSLYDPDQLKWLRSDIVTIEGVLNVRAAGHEVAAV